MQVELIIKDKRIGKEFPMPTRATPKSAGLDIVACLPMAKLIRPGEVCGVSAGVALHLSQPDVFGMLAPRSGLGVKYGIVLANTVGIIDADYQGEIIVPLFNRSRRGYHIQPGDRIAQLIIMHFARVKKFIIKEQFSEAESRGAGGFGSTGK